MNPAEYTARRATVDDLSGLKQLWERAHLQVLDLEKRLTDFQLVVSYAGDLAGAIGLHVEGRQGRLHSEAFAQTDDREGFRQQLWERVQAVARNHGLTRLWTRETSPFWRTAGFADATPDFVKKLPPGFGDAEAGWLTLKLKEESAAVLSAEQEFELFQTAQKEETERLMRLGRSMKLVVAAILGAALLIAVIYLVKIAVRNP